MVQLSNYIQDCQDLLRDSRSQFTGVPQLTRYINQARREIAKRSACLQALVTGQAPFGTGAQPGYAIPGALIPGTLPGSLPNNSNEPGAASTPSNGFNTIPGVELYTYQYAKPFLRAQYSGYDSIIYVFNVAVSNGGFTPTLDFLPWDDLQAFCRAYNIGVNSYPSLWSQKGLGENGQVWVFPVPVNQSFSTMQWECICTPLPLYTDSDYEALPEIFHGCVKYYGCYLAYLAQQRTGQAEIMRGLFDEQLGISAVSADFGHIDTHYPSWP